MSTKTENTKTPGQFIVFYRSGNNPNMSKVFNFDGDQKDATLRARQHCEQMNYQFILCRRFLVDLDEQEAQKRQNPDYMEPAR